MSTTIRPEIAKENPYWISKHRYYELKHFCLQYKEWQDELRKIDIFSYSSPVPDDRVKTSNVPDTVLKCVEMRDRYLRNLEMVEKTSLEAAEDLAPYLLKAVTNGLAYEHLSMVDDIPCCRETYYEVYRRFFFLLSSARG